MKRNEKEKHWFHDLVFGDVYLCTPFLDSVLFSDNHARVWGAGDVLGLQLLHSCLLRRLSSATLVW